MMKIYHNPRCTKSRNACNILAEKGIQAEIIEYLKTPPSPEELKELLNMLGVKAEDIVRKTEPLFKEKFQGKSFSEEEWIKILSENPILIQRPILIKGKKAVIGRSDEKIAEILG